MAWVKLLPIWTLAPVAWAAIDVYEFDDPADEQRFRDLIFELRCPKCQNQNISGSNAPLSADLRKKVYDMIRDGYDDGEIVGYLVQRYGDFVTYRPPIEPVTWPLWFGPFVLIASIGFGLALWVRRRARAAPVALDGSERKRLDALLERYGRDGEKSE